jgi:hypothetical protein
MHPPLHMTVGKKVAIIGAGGIGFDVAEFISHDHAHASSSTSVEAFAKEWGIDMKNETRGGVAGIKPCLPTLGMYPPPHMTCMHPPPHMTCMHPPPHMICLPTLGPREKIYLLQRKSSKHGDELGKTTGWIHRTVLKNKGVEMIGGVSYDKIDDAGMHTCTHARTHARTHTCSHARARARAHTCIYMYDIYMYMYLHIYLYKHISMIQAYTSRKRPRTVPRPLRYWTCILLLI